jgi:Ner family transcriptional regulator
LERIVTETAPWHREQIKAAIRMKKTSLAALARENGLAKDTMYWALIKPHARANAIIAAFLGMSMHELWPAWYPPTVSPSASKPIAKPQALSRLNKKVA